MTYLDAPCNRYVYLHTRKDNGAIFYVGKGCGKRIFDEKSRNHLWKSVVKDAGGFNFVKMIDGLTDDEAYCFEEIVVSEDTGRKISEAKLGHVQTEETKLKISQKKRGVPWTDARRNAQNKKGLVDGLVS